MPDPIQVEQEFQELMEDFESTLSIRHRYRLFWEFVKNLEGSFKKYESYIIQLFEELPVYYGPLSWSGLDPAVIEEDIQLLESIRSTLDLSKYSQNFGPVKESLQQVCLLLYACLNEDEKVDDYLKKIAGISLEEGANLDDQRDAKNSTLKRLFHHISAKLQAGSDVSSAQRSSLNTIIRHLGKIIKPDEGNVLVPVVEHYERNHPKRIRYGRLRKMSVELYDEADSLETDELIWATNIYGAKTPTLGKNENIVRAARKLYDSTVTNRSRGKYFRGGIRFENSTAIHDGYSASLAIAVLWYIRLLKVNGERERYAVDPHAVITGNINEEGVVQAVDIESIKLKVRAAFFSWANVLVVPFSQRTMAERELEVLQKRFPGKRLSIIGVNHLREVFYDRRVAVHKVQKRVPYLLNRLRNEKSKFVLLPLIIVLLLIVARLAYGPIDRNPVIIEYEGSDIVLKNSSGATIDRVEIGEITVNRQNSVGEFERRPLSTLIDLNKDGINELIYSNRVIRRISDQSFIKAWSVSGDSLIWDQKFISSYSYPRQSAIMNFNLRAVEIGVLDTKAGLKIAVNTSVIQYFQSVVHTMNAMTGEIEQEYVHPGRFDDMYIEDLNGDDNDEIILTGINNAYWSAAIAVLEYGKANGHAPATVDYIPSNINPANEYRYILIPKTLIGEYFSSMLKYNRGKEINIDELNENILFAVQEGRRELYGHSDDLLVLYYFDLNLNLLGVGTSDLYDIVARELYEEGEIREIPDFDYFEAYKDSILYWTGEEFLLAKEYFKDN